MFSVGAADSARQRLLARAEADPLITGAAVIGSHVSGAADRWSDVDLVLAVDGPLDAAMNEWTAFLCQDFGAVHHWDLPAGPTIYRLFLLPDWLEIDIGFTPGSAFGARGPHWQTIFGQGVRREPAPDADIHYVAGQAWHHVRKGRVCIERGQPWQAEHWISAARDEIITLACQRLGHPSAHAKGAHLLPVELTASLASTLIRSLDPAELRRALTATIAAFSTELHRSAPALAATLAPLLQRL